MVGKEERYKKIIKNLSPSLYNASIEILNKEQMRSTLFSTDALATAPILFTYVWWIINEAKQKNIKRLYFLARDGYILKEIAERICKANKINIDCRYLYCSRIAWRLPQYHLDKEKCIEKIFINSIGVNLDKICDRVNLLQSERDEIYTLLKIEQKDRKKYLQRYEIQEYKSRFMKCKEFMNYVIKNSKMAYETTIGYLEQEGLTEAINYAIVDSGWTGSMQTCLSNLLGGKIIKGFYFGIYNLPQNADSSNFYSFYFDRNRSIKNKIYFNNNLFECLCSAPDGMTKGYKYLDGRYIPVFASEFNINKEAWDFNLHIETIINFTNSALQKLDISIFNLKRSKQLVFLLCKEFMIYPSLDEVDCYGNFKFSDDVTEDNVDKLASNISLEDIKKNLLMWRVANRLRPKKYFIPFKQSCWIYGSVVRLNQKKYRNIIKHILLLQWIQYLYLGIRKGKY